jgi:hypothetical protein
MITCTCDCAAQRGDRSARACSPSAGARGRQAGVDSRPRMQALYDPARHDPLADLEWSPARARDAIAAICRDAEGSSTATDSGRCTPGTASRHARRGHPVRALRRRRRDVARARAPRGRGPAPSEPRRRAARAPGATIIASAGGVAVRGPTHAPVPPARLARSARQRHSRPHRPPRPAAIRSSRAPARCAPAVSRGVAVPACGGRARWP